MLKIKIKICLYIELKKNNMENSYDAKFTTCMEDDSRNIFVVDNDSFMTGRSPNYMGIDENQHTWL